MRLRRPIPLLSLFALVAGCGDDANSAGSWSNVPDAAADQKEADATTDPEVIGIDGKLEASAKDTAWPDVIEVGPDAESGTPGFVGSSCKSADDCAYAGAVCLTAGVAGGVCSLACETTCPDQDGFPVTFCADASAVPEASVIPNGLCLSRCDFGAYPTSGCREGFGCAKVARPNDATNIKFACLPNRQSELGPCYLALAARGVQIEPTVMADEHPSTHPTLTCHVEDPLYLLSPVHGVALHNGSGTVTSRILASCKMADAVVSTIDDVAPFGVVALRHMGTYNCRVIAGTSTLSEHSFATAIDIAGFDMGNGKVYSVLGDWEHDTTAPATVAGKFLYEAAHRWYDAKVWNIILTPNYNALHDNHFHVDLTGGSHFIGFTDGRYFGPAPYVD